jgi:SAM-dependent methyltransferase
MSADPGQSPNIARVCDYLVGGSHNSSADRAAAQALITLEPNTLAIMRSQRAFLARAVRFMADAGIRQFLDIGSGIPTQQNVHEVAQAAAPATHVVYVDIDPATVAEGNAILAGNDGAVVIQGDLTRPADLLGDAGRLIDLSRPAGLVLSSILHFFPDSADPQGLIASLGDALAAGSYLVISHASRQDRPADMADALESAYDSQVATRPTMRTRAEVERFFDGFGLVAPGVVPTPLWRPEPPGEELAGVSWSLAGVAVK